MRKPKNYDNVIAEYRIIDAKFNMMGHLPPSDFHRLLELDGLLNYYDAIGIDPTFKNKRKLYEFDK